jgi:hypothetical protein
MLISFFLLVPVWIPAQEKEGVAVSAQVALHQAAMDRGRKALKAGNITAATEHFLFAYERSPQPSDVLPFLWESAWHQSDQAVWWLLEWAHELVSEKGKVLFPVSWGRRLEEHPEGFSDVVSLARLRALALKQVQKRIAKKSKGKKSGENIEVEWLEDFSRVVAGSSPPLQASVKKYGAIIQSERSLWYPVVDDLIAAARSAMGSGNTEMAIRVGRCLRGMTSQANMIEADQVGPKAIDMDRAGRVANEALGRSRAALARDGMTITTIAELEKMNEEERRQLTLSKASFGHPVQCPSPRDLYLVETSCGWETIYGTATTVEYHHDRLLNWYGVDPFQGRQGTVRVCPESHGLEAEGGTRWWAGGFQGGDTTVMKFTMGTIPGLGRGLTHELTHRFDGAVFGGLPAWLSEGRASWTGGAYGSMKETNFVANHCSPGTMNGARGLGYGRLEELRKLIDGSLEEYRDNYTAGYALYVYLNTASGKERLPLRDEDGKLIPGQVFPMEAPPIYAANLQRFMAEKRRSNGDPISAFEYYFADGKGGRPMGLRQFTAWFDEYLSGFNNQQPAWWTERYTTAVPGSDPSPRIYDEPTWTWLRNRSEPWFGQDHARMAGDLFLDLGKWSEALSAYAWCLAVDEPSPATLDQMVHAATKVGNDNLAWMLQHWGRFSATGFRKILGGDSAQRELAPFLEDYSAVYSLLKDQRRVAEAWLVQGWETSAQAVIAEHNQLASWLGLPEFDKAVASKIQEKDIPWRALSEQGWGEERLTGYEKERVAGLWVEEKNLTLHVGRKTPRGATGTVDRSSPRRDAVVLSEGWQEPGRYRIRAQVEATTAWLSGGITFGWTRRDRNFRLGFSHGDWEFASGETETQEGERKLSWSLTGLYARRGAKNGAYSFRDHRRFFVVEIEVDGPTAEVFFDGVSYGTLSTLDGSAIHGRIGFYTSTGAMKILAPSVKRLDRLRHQSGAGSIAGGLHTAKLGEESWRKMLGRPVSGFPLAPSGTVFLWWPEQSKKKTESLEDEDWYDRVADSLDAVLDGLEAEFPSQGMLLLLPPSFPESALSFFEEDFAGVLVGGFEVMRHAQAFSTEEDRRTIQGWGSPVLAFVDPIGFLRYAKRMTRFRATLPSDFRQLLLELRDHSRPGLAGSGD